MDNRGKKALNAQPPHGGPFGMTPLEHTLHSVPSQQKAKATEDPTVLRIPHGQAAQPKPAAEPKKAAGDQAQPQPQAQPQYPATNRPSGYIPTGIYAYRGLPQAPAPAKPAPPPPPPQPPVSPMARYGPSMKVVPTPIPAAPAAPATTTPSWGHSDLFSPPASIGGPPIIIGAQYRSLSTAKRLLIIFLILFLLALGALGGWVWWTEAHKVNTQAMLNQTLAAAMSTRTYNESLVVQKGRNSITQSRLADFRKVGEPHVYVDNILLDASQDPIEATVIGNNYFAKKHFSPTTISQIPSTSEQQLLNKVNDQWVQVVKDGTPVQNEVTKDLGVTTQLQTVRVVAPSPLLIGYFSPAQQQQLANFIAQNHIYTTPASQPTEVTLDGQKTWQLNVKVDPAKVGELNTKAAELLGSSEAKSVASLLKNEVPSSMTIWARQSDQRVAQYSYTLDGSLYTYRYSQVNGSTDVNAPEAVDVNALGVSTKAPSDASVKESVNELKQSLQDLALHGGQLPVDAGDFGDFLSSNVDPQLLGQFNVQLATGTPKTGEIFYQPRSVCPKQNSEFSPSESSTAFAVLGKLKKSLYCVDNVIK